jgi:hypothetical protein
MVVNMEENKMSNEDCNKEMNLSIKDAINSLGGSSGSLAVEAYFTTGRYTPSNLSPLETEAKFIRGEYKI